MKPLVSVSILTYNHKEFIAKAIDSVLMQKTQFDFEILIGDDCSNDGTQDILKKYQNKNSEKISLTLHPRKYYEIPGRTNNLTNLYNCRGTYIAMLDGDDYWTDNYKLQRQVEFLEKNQDYAVAFHDVLCKTEYHGDENRFSNRKLKLKTGRKTFTHEDLLTEWFVPTSSVIFRNFITEELPEWFQNVYSADHALLLLASTYGKIYYDPRQMSVWRQHPNSFTQKFPRSIAGAKIRAGDRKILIQAFPGIKHHPKMLRRQYGCFRGLAKLYLKRNILWSIYYLFRAASIYPIVKIKLSQENRKR